MISYYYYYYYIIIIIIIIIIINFNYHAHTTPWWTMSAFHCTFDQSLDLASDHQISIQISQFSFEV